MSDTSIPAPLSLGFFGGSLTSAVGYAHFVSALMDNQWSLAGGVLQPGPGVEQADGHV